MINNMAFICRRIRVYMCIYNSQSFLLNINIHNMTCYTDLTTTITDTPYIAPLTPTFHALDH